MSQQSPRRAARLCSYIALIVLVLGTTTSGSALARETTRVGADIAQPIHRVIAHLGTSAGRAQAISIAAEHRAIGRTGRELLYVRAPSLAAALARMRALPGVTDVEEDHVVRLDLTPNDTFYQSDPFGGGGQWNVRITSTHLAWDTQRGSAGVTVAVVDTGADRGHPDLAAALLPGRVFLSGPSAECAPNSDASDDNGHGTHVAGIIGAIGQNNLGIAGMAFGVRLLPLKALDCTGSGYVSDMSAAITAAADAGARVINLSLGSTSSSATLQVAVDYATSRGALVVAAAGNCGVTSSTCPVANVANYPAAYPNAIAVGATDSNDQPASFSTAGPYVDVSAPGVRILSTYPMGFPSALPGYQRSSGTSMAAPHVAGLAALLVSAMPGVTVAQLRSAIVGTAKDVGAPGPDTKSGTGRIDSLAALRSLQGTAPAATPPPAPTASPSPPAMPTPPPAASPTPAPTTTPTCTSTTGAGIAPPAEQPAGIPGFHASWHGQSGYMTLCPGHSATAVVAYYNSGSQGWVRGRMGQVAYLGTWETIPGQDRPSVLGGDGQMGTVNTGWPRYNRVAVQPADYVAPGQVSWFQFTVTAPQTPGSYRLYIRPLVEGSAWMEDYGVYWEVTVRR